MPRFGLKAFLVAFAVVALWLATFTVPDPTLQGSGNEIRQGFLLAILIASGVAAVCFRGTRRAFWSGFFVAMLLLGVSNDFEGILGIYRPNVFIIASNWTSSFGLAANQHAVVYCNIWPALVLGVSAIVGFSSAYIYNQSRKTANK